jgi:transcriptional regulator with XRE-family HTH domain
MSQQALADQVGVSRARVSRIERDEEPDVPAWLLARMAVHVGLDLSVKTYPGGDPILDAAQQRLLGRLRKRLGDAWAWQFEVALPIPGDLRAWDSVGTCAGNGLVIHVEAETRIDDIQALLRRIGRKCRDGGATRVLLVVADTRHNREVVEAAAAELREMFPADPRYALGALAGGKDPGANALVLL